jgi:hypothetical protein
MNAIKEDIPGKDDSDPAQIRKKLDAHHSRAQLLACSKACSA